MNKEVKKAFCSSEKQDWQTPENLFNSLNRIFSFDLDAAASSENTKCKSFFSKENNALVQDWYKNHKSVFCNPEYDRKIQPLFLKYGFQEFLKSIRAEKHLVYLIPARPDTKIWQEYILEMASYVCFIKGRVKFVGAENGALFPSALVILSTGFNVDKLGQFGKVLAVKGFYKYEQLRLFA